MNGVRIYKDNFRKNSLIALFLSDKSPAIVIGLTIPVVVFGIFYSLLHINNLPFYIVSIGTLEVALAVFTHGRKDNEMKVKSRFRHIRYLFNRKKFNTKQLDSTLSDFKITGNYIERK